MIRISTVMIELCCGGKREIWCLDLERRKGGGGEREKGFYGVAFGCCAAY